MSLKALKILVYTMGVMLMAGFIILPVMVYNKFTGGVPTTATPAKECTGEAKYTLPGYDLPMAASVEGGSMILMFKKAGSDGGHVIEAVTLDRCTGTLIHKLQIELPDAGRAGMPFASIAP